MSTILFFTSDRFAFANLSPSATTEKIILTPDPVDGSRLFIGNSTMISYDARCNISTFDGSRATMTIDTLNNRVGIGISSPTAALDVVDAGGVRIVGPTNITGATTFTGNSRVIGTATATSFTGSAIGLTSIPAARIVGNLPTSVYANATIPVAALSGYDNGSLLLSGHLGTESLNVSSITAQEARFSSLSSGNASIDTLSVRAFSTAFGYTSTLTIGRLFAGSISSGSIGSLLTDAGTFSSISAGTANINGLNTALLSTGAGVASSFTVGILYAATISSGTLISLSSAMVTVSNTGATNTTNITTLSNRVNYLLAVSNISAVTMSTSYGFFSTISAGTISGRFVGDGSLLTNLPVTASLTTVSNNLTTVSNTGATNTTNITSVSNTVNYLLAVSNISAVTMSTSYGFFSTLSAGTISGRFVGDGSLLTNLPVTASLTTISNNLTTVSNSGATNTTNITTISNNLTTVSNSGATNTTNIITVSNTVNYLLAVSNISAVTTSTSYGFFSTLSAGTISGRFVGDGSLLTGIVGGGGMSYVPPVLSTTLLSTGILTAGNISVGVISTTYGFFSTISAGSIFARFVGDGSLLTNLPVTASLTTVSNNLNTVSNTGVTNTTNITTVSNTVNYLLAVSNISAVTMSTSYGFFSTISAGTVFGRFIGDGSLLTNLPVTASLTTVSNNLTTVSNSGATNTTNITTVSNTVNYLLTVSNISAVTMSTTYGFFSTISAGTVYGRFVGDGSRLTGITSGGGLSYVPPVLSTTLLSTGILTASNISTVGVSTNTGFASSFHINRLTASTTSALLGLFSSISVGQAYISSLTVDSLFIGNDIGFTNMGDVIATSLSTILVTTANLTAVNVSIASASTNYGFFSTISAGTVFGRFVGDGSLLTNLPVTASLTTVSNNLTTVSNTGATNTTNITTVSNTANYLLAVSNISAITMSTSYGFFSTISAGTVFGRFVGDGSLLTNLPITASLTTVSNNLTTVSNNLTTVSNTGATNTTNITTVSNTANYLLAVSNISAVTMSTSYGFFSTISAGTVFGRFVGDGSLLTNLPITASLTTVSNNLTTVSNNLTTVSNNLTTVSNTGATNTTNITTVSNTANYLLAVSNISAVTMSTSYGFFSTISAGTVFGRFLGDGSLLTGITGGGGMSYVPPVLSTTLLSTGILTARNISVSIISTGYGFFSTISTGSVYGKFIGDGSGLTGISLGITNLLSTQALYISSLSSANITSQQGYISSLIVDVLSFGLSNSYISMGDVIATSISTIQVFTSSLLTTNLLVGNVSSLSYIAFPGLQLGYNQTVIAEQSTGTGTQELLFYKGSTTTDRIRLQTTGSIIFEPGVGARSFPAVGSNVTPAMIINTSSNVGIGIASPTTTLDVAGTGRFQILSTQQLFVSSISSGIVYGRFAGDGSLLTGIVGAGGGLSYVPPVLSTTLLSTANLTASTINTDILNARLLSTASGTASSFTIGSMFASTGSISSIRGNEARISTVTANTLSSFIVYASSVNTPNIYVTNIYANDGGIANVVASSLNASRAVFVQVIASSFQGSLIGKNLLTVETY